VLAIDEAITCITQQEEGKRRGLRPRVVMETLRVDLRAEEFHHLDQPGEPLSRQTFRSEKNISIHRLNSPDPAPRHEMTPVMRFTSITMENELLIS